MKSKPQAISKLALRRAIADKMFDNIRWETESRGVCDCPGASSHSTPGMDATLFIDGCPTLHCFHQSCKGDVEDANEEFRAEVREAEADPNFKFVPSEEDQRRWRQHREQLRLLAQARDNLPRILAEFQIPPSEWLSRSPVKLTGDARDEWRQLLQLFSPDDNIWIGQLWDTGQPHHACHFRPVKDWLAQEAVAPGPHICPASFRRGAYTRAEDSVLGRAFLVVESDTLSKRESSAIFQWLQQQLHLYAVVYTGNKSLHGWFKCPDCDYAGFQELKVILTGLNCDPAMFRVSQPCRLPGWLREDTQHYQRLLYLDLSETTMPPASLQPQPTTPTH